MFIKYFIAALFFSQTDGLYFHMQETERKCFLEEIPEDTLVKGKYRVQLYDENSRDYLPATSGIGMQVEVLDPNDKFVLSKFYSSEGAFFFTSNIPGNHHICLHTNSTKWKLFAGGRLRVHFELATGEHANDYKEIAASDKLSELQLRARQIIDQVDQILKEQAYQRFREESFRGTSESTNRRVLWWAFVQTLVLVATGVWQMHHMKSFFEAKKLV